MFNTEKVYQIKMVNAFVISTVPNFLMTTYNENYLCSRSNELDGPLQQQLLHIMPQQYCVYILSECDIVPNIHSRVITSGVIYAYFWSNASFF